MNRTAVLILTLLLRGCSGPNWVAVPSFPPPAEHAVLNVFVWSGPTHRSISGAPVFGVSSLGVAELGRTNPDGEFNIAKEYLREAGIVALLFCSSQDQMYCTSIRLAGTNALGFDELTVELRPFVLIDRIRVK